MFKIIDGAKISTKIKEDIKLEISKLDKNKPCLAVVMLGDDVPSHIYVKNKKIACEYTGILSKSYNLPAETLEEDLLALIDKLNKDKNINGILVQLPLPKHINEKNVLLKIDPLKDVDGFHPYNIGMISTNNALLKPCTPSGCIELLKSTGIDLVGKNALVIGRSNIVGKPLAMLLLNEHSTVTIAHSKTENLESITKQADIIIASVGIANFLKPNMVKDGVVLIDVGMNRLENKKLCGDIDFSCKDKASYITPVPGGVGPMTIAMLMQNCLKAYKIQNNIKF